MTDSDPKTDVPGQRTLAAILFTDVVGYSARMQEDEDRTLDLVRRDMAFMTDQCDRAEGKVVKSTGDGLLMYFTSAVNAVQCALQIQRHFAQEAETSRPEDVLQHRVGIHLGDVFLHGSDVMGDGVNIAARIQGEAEPGGICVSQTVYDVVKNRIAVQATYLGPRELKNIREAVPVYRILLAAQDGLEGGGEAKGRPRRQLPRALLFGSAGIVAAAIAITIWLLAGPGSRDEPPEAAGKNAVPEPASSNTIEFAGPPGSKEDFDRLYQEHGKTPQGAAATFLATVLLWQRDAELARECLGEILGPSCRGPRGRVSPAVRSQLRAFARRPHVARSYIVGPTPAGNYRLPPPPYRIKFVANERSAISPDRATVFMVTSGAIRPRPVVLTRSRKGLWQIEQMSSLTVGIRRR